MTIEEVEPIWPLWVSAGEYEASKKGSTTMDAVFKAFDDNPMIPAGLFLLLVVMAVMRRRQKKQNLRIPAMHRETSVTIRRPRSPRCVIMRRQKPILAPKLVICSPKSFSDGRHATRLPSATLCVPWLYLELQDRASHPEAVTKLPRLSLAILAGVTAMSGAITEGR